MTKLITALTLLFILLAGTYSTYEANANQLLINKAIEITNQGGTVFEDMSYRTVTGQTGCITEYSDANECNMSTITFEELKTALKR